MSKKMPSSQLHIYRKCTRRQSQSWVSNGYHFRPFNCQKIGFPAMPNGHCVKRTTVGCFIYIVDSSNSSSITFWTSQFGSSSRSNWIGNSNDSWTDKQSSHFSTTKDMSEKLSSFSGKNHNKQILKGCWNVVEILLNKSFTNDILTKIRILELNW